MTNQIITNFITNHIENYIELTNIGLNSETLSNLTCSKSLECANKFVCLNLDTISNLLCNSWLDIFLKITSTIIPMLALAYTIYINYKLNKINRVIPLINSDFDRYINDLRLIYTELNIHYRKYTSNSDSDILFNKIKCDRVAIHQKIKMILISLEKIKQNANKSYNIYYKNMETVENCLEKINNCRNAYEYRDYFLDYLKYIINYCATIPISIYYEASGNKIEKESIDSIYKEIEKIQNELNGKIQSFYKN